MQKKNQLNVMLNEIIKTDDPTVINCSFIILDFNVSHNNVIVEKETALGFAPSIKNKPIRAKYYSNSDDGSEDDNFGGHEQYMSKDRNGEQMLDRDTVPIGVFTSEGYIKEIEIDGELQEVLVADAQLWYSQFTNACDLIIEWYNNGINVNMSCEYLYSNYEIKDKVEYHKLPIYFEAHCILASENRGSRSEVLPAYDSAKLLSMNQLEEFNQLVAQAINQKEVQDLEDLTQTNEEVTPEAEEDLKSQKNELSLYEVSEEIRNQVRANTSDAEYLWVSDVFQSYAIVAVDTDTEYKHYKFDYTVEGDVVTVNFESKTEVKEKREWVSVTNELTEQINTLATEKETLTSQINELTTTKNELLEKFNSATETITSLNTKIEELKPLQEQVLNAQREQLLAEKVDHFTKAFNNVGGKEKFETEEVQSLVAQSIEDTVEGKDALLKLNEMIVELVKEAQLQDTSVAPLLSTSSKRVDLVPAKDDFASRYKD